MGTQGHGAGLSHLSGDHSSVNMDAKEPQCGIAASPSQISAPVPSPEHMGTVLRVTSGSRPAAAGPQQPPVTVSLK